MDAVDALTRLGGIASTSELVGLTSRKRVRRAVAVGRIVHVSRSRYALPSQDDARAVAVAVNGHLRLLSAAAHWGWKVKWAAQWPQIQVSVKPDDPVDASLAVGVLARADLDGWATSRVRTVLDCAAELPFDEALAVADSALRSGQVTREQLEAALAADASSAVRRVVAHASSLAANPFESVLRAILIEAGISVVPQWGTTIGGITYHPDLADPIHGIAIEADSFAHHAARADHEEDCLRYNALVIGGWIVLRFTWEQVMFSPGEVVATVRAALALRHEA
jgi:very-short-patch-repair endonuclease